MNRLSIKPRARIDLNEQYEYIRHQNLDAALRFLDAAEGTLDLLLEAPNIGYPCHFKDPKLAQIRKFPIRGFENYLVIYLFADGCVEVFRVLHGARDIPTILREN